MAPQKPTLEQTRAELLRDRYTQEIADILGMPLEEYVSAVLEFVKNPKKQPEFLVLPESEVKKHGGATFEDVRQWMEDVAEGRVKLPAVEMARDGFEVSKGKKKE
jgi:hypothetical protein